MGQLEHLEGDYLKCLKLMLMSLESVEISELLIGQFDIYQAEGNWVVVIISSFSSTYRLIDFILGIII